MSHNDAADASEAIWPEFLSPQHRSFRVLLIDDHPIVREGVGTLLALERDILMVGDAGDLETGIRLAQQLVPDLVICDLVMPGSRGASAVRRLCCECGPSHVMVLTAYDSLELVREVFEAGAIGYVRKSAPSADLLSAVRSAAAGCRIVCPGTIAMLLRPWLAGVVVQYKLDSDDRQILRLIALGVPTRQIAEVLGRGAKAVGKRRTQLMRRLSLPSAAAIAQFAVHSKLVLLEEVEGQSRRLRSSPATPASQAG